MARSSGARRASDPTSEEASARAVSARSPKKLPCNIASSSTPICSAVESSDSSFSSSLLAAAADARRSAKLCSRMSSRVGGTSSSIWWRRSSSSVRNRTISVSLRLFVTTGMRTKLNRRLSADERSLTPRSRLFAVAMMEKPGWANTMLSSSSSGIETYFSDRIEISASCTSLVERVSSSNRPMTPRSIAVMIGDGIIDSRDWPFAITMDTFHEYLMWSSVVPAVPCTTSVELRLIAAASNSASQLLPVPGSPMSSRPRSEARVTMERSTKLRSPNHFWLISRSRPSARSEPSTNRRTIFGDRRQENGLGPVSMDSSQSSSAAYLISAGARRISAVMSAIVLGEERFEFDDELADVAGDHGGAEIFEALAEPWVDALRPELVTDPTGMNFAPERWTATMLS